MNTINNNINSETQRIFNEWDKLSVDEKKKIADKRNAAYNKYKHSVFFAPGFSFDSDSKVKLYEVNA